VTLSFLLFSGIALLLLLLLIAVFRDPEKSPRLESDQSPADESGHRHVTFFAQIRQALAPDDYAFLAKRSGRQLARRVRKERRRVALLYLSSLRKEFARLWKLARVIAAMSPQVGAAREIARFRLGVGFYLRYELIRLKFALGLGPIPDLGAVSEVVSNLAVRLETAMSDLGERAALASDLASTLDRGGLHIR
jgi:hypothetical protein